MCAMLIGVPAGNPVRLTANVAVEAMILPLASFVTSNVMVAVPVPEASAPTMGGTSLAGDNVALKTGWRETVGFVTDDELPQPPARTPSARTMTDRRFIV